MPKYTLQIEVESDSKPKDVKKFVGEILGVTEFSDTVKVKKIEVSESKDSTGYMGICIIANGAMSMITTAFYKKGVDYFDAKNYIRRRTDPYDKHVNDIKLLEAYGNPIVQKDLCEYLSSNKIRKVIEDAIERARKEQAEGDQTSKA